MSVINFLENKIAELEARIAELTKERDDLAQYHGGHYPNCGGMDEADHRCDCGYLQGEAYRELVDKIAEQAAEIARLKSANEGWHRRVQEFVPEKESYQRRIEELEAELRTQKDECERFHKPA